jgi:oxygen-independent coproporphyrinogen-3 oxidase
MSQYIEACRAELFRSSVVAPATSVFFGGGTPSLVPASLLMSLLGDVPLAPGAEVTIECNPESVSPSSLASYRGAGVTRVSFGVQSMVPHVLASLGRQHSVKSVGQAVSWARDAGFETFNIDLIYGAAGESVDDLRVTLAAVEALQPPHVSAYALTVEPGTPLARVPSRWPDDDDQASKFALIDDTLGAWGLEWYEISNWARPGHECRHNQLYWAQGDYVGIGCAAHSHVGGRRWWNVRTPERYIDLVSAGESVVAGSEVLAPVERALEGLQLRLRTREGVPSGAVPFGVGVDDLVARGSGRAVLTRRGRLLANEVTARLVVA